MSFCILKRDSAEASNILWHDLRNFSKSEESSYTFGEIFPNNRQFVASFDSKLTSSTGWGVFSALSYLGNSLSIMVSFIFAGFVSFSLGCYNLSEAVSSSSKLCCCTAAFYIACYYKFELCCQVSSSSSLSIQQLPPFMQEGSRDMDFAVSFSGPACLVHSESGSSAVWRNFEYQFIGGKCSLMLNLPETFDSQAAIHCFEHIVNAALTQGAAVTSGDHTFKPKKTFWRRSKSDWSWRLYYSSFCMDPNSLSSGEINRNMTEKKLLLMFFSSIFIGALLDSLIFPLVQSYWNQTGVVWVRSLVAEAGEGKPSLLPFGDKKALNGDSSSFGRRLPKSALTAARPFSHSGYRDSQISGMCCQGPLQCVVTQ